MFGDTYRHIYYQRVGENGNSPSTCHSFKIGLEGSFGKPKRKALSSNTHSFLQIFEYLRFKKLPTFEPYFGISHDVFPLLLIWLKVVPATSGCVSSGLETFMFLSLFAAASISFIFCLLLDWLLEWFWSLYESAIFFLSWFGSSIYNVF